MQRLVAYIRRERRLDTPIYLVSELKGVESLSLVPLGEVTGYIYLDNGTPAFSAKEIVFALERYAASLKPPFFGALMDYDYEGNQMWTCPGHQGGAFYRRSPAGRLFVEHLGEAIFRNDIDNSVPELGDLLTHVGPALAAQKEAAKVFGADRTYFILNGTSTSNKVVTAALLKRGDLVLFDRNNHKSNHQGALLLAGAIPIYLETDRNPQGLIGPIDYDALDEKKLREQIRTHPLVTDKEAWQRERPFRLAIIEQCSYDGTIYNAGSLIKRIGHLCDYVHFDEAWAGFMKFHPLFAGHFAMGLENLDASSPGIVATQSTHKQLAGFSQASQIHVRDEHLKGQARRTGHRRFNEMFMLHCSTSPFYPLFASLDVDARMHKGRNGLSYSGTTRSASVLRRARSCARSRPSSRRRQRTSARPGFSILSCPTWSRSKTRNSARRLLACPGKTFRPTCWRASPPAGRWRPMRAGTASVMPRPAGR